MRLVEMVQVDNVPKNSTSSAALKVKIVRCKDDHPFWRLFPHPLQKPSTGFHAGFQPSTVVSISANSHPSTIPRWLSPDQVGTQVRR